MRPSPRAKILALDEERHNRIFASLGVGAGFSWQNAAKSCAIRTLVPVC